MKSIPVIFGFEERCVTFTTRIYENDTPVEQLLPECKSMARYVLSSGEVISPQVVMMLVEAEDALKQHQDMNSDNLAVRHKAVGDLTKVHAILAETIAPASPRTILLLANQEAHKSMFAFLGPVPLIRQLLLLAIANLILFLFISMSPLVDGETDSYSLIKSDGLKLLVNYLFLLAAAGMGSSFSALFLANSFIKSGTFDPKYNATYWNRWILGIMAGLILALFIPVQDLAADESNFEGFSKPLLALLGGFASAAVYRILNKIVNTLVGIVKESSQVAIQQGVEAANNASQRQVSSYRREIAGELSQIRSLAESASDPETLKTALDDLQDRLFEGNRIGGVEPTLLKEPQLFEDAATEKVEPQSEDDSPSSSKEGKDV